MTTKTKLHPFNDDWQKLGHLPDLHAVKPAEFRPAIEAAMAAHKAEHEAIADNPEAPTFANTIVPLELAGGQLGRIMTVLYMHTGVLSTPEIRAVDEDVSPLLSNHYSELAFNPKIFARIDAVYDQRDQLDPQQRRLVEKLHRGYVDSGAKLPPAQQQELAGIKAKLSELETQFSNRLIAEQDEKLFAVEDKAKLAGVPDDLLANARERAEKAGKPGYLISVIREEVEPILTACDVRETRQALHAAFELRGDAGDKYDTKDLIPQILELRRQQAALFGEPTYAHFSIRDNMAKTPDNAYGLMRDVWDGARPAWQREEAALQTFAAAQGLNDKLQPWDWLYYTEKQRQQQFDLNDEMLAPYLTVDNVRKAAFAVASNLFGLRFEKADEELWHPATEAFNVIDEQGRKRALFVVDFFGREGKQSGAWMGELAGGHKIGEGQMPIIYNVSNFPAGQNGKPAVATLDMATTLFHEFGHGLHGMLTQAIFPSLAGTNVKGDFVELPSQFYEHFLTHPQVMREHLRHHETGAPIPDTLIEKIVKTSQYNEGFSMGRYLLSAMMDLDLHRAPEPDKLDVASFEKKKLAEYGMPHAGQMMHRPMHHKHLFTSSHYAAGYYFYGWAGVLDHDAFAAFEEAGNPYDKATAKRLHDYIYSAGDTQDPAELFRQYRGRDPNREALLRNKGFANA